MKVIKVGSIIVFLVSCISLGCNRFIMKSFDIVLSLKIYGFVHQRLEDNSWNVLLIIEIVTSTTLLLQGLPIKWRIKRQLLRFQHKTYRASYYGHHDLHTYECPKAFEWLNYERIFIGTKAIFSMQNLGIQSYAPLNQFYFVIVKKKHGSGRCKGY